jgi:hypothetical protein
MLRQKVGQAAPIGVSLTHIVMLIARQESEMWVRAQNTRNTRNIVDGQAFNPQHIPQQRRNRPATFFLGLTSANGKTSPNKSPVSPISPKPPALITLQNPSFQRLTREIDYFCDKFGLGTPCHQYW